MMVVIAFDGYMANGGEDGGKRPLVPVPQVVVST